jgi:tRNA (mo5U34)-methyltransferase
MRDQATQGTGGSRLGIERLSARFRQLVPGRGGPADAEAGVRYKGRLIRADDPILDGWYHTIELAPGIVTRATYDHRPIVHKIGLPASLKGKTALDVATGDGFWAYELEKRGADRVVAIDVAKIGDYDLTPGVKAARPRRWFRSVPYNRFKIGHTIRRSKVRYKQCNVYDLSPRTVGTFDFVYCGSLMMHLFNPLQAMINIRSVTREMAIVESGGLDPSEYAEIETQYPDSPLVNFACRKYEELLGEHHVYWHFSTRALCDMLLYAGFARVAPQEQFLMTGPLGGKVIATPIHAFV